MKHSREDTPRGSKLKHVCDTHGLKEIVRKPTRGPYLLDLVLTDHDNTNVRLGPKLADHSSLLIQVSDAYEARVLGTRHFWHYRDADWLAMETRLDNKDWSQLNIGTVDDAVDHFY